MNASGAVIPDQDQQKPAAEADSLSASEGSPKLVFPNTMTVVNRYPPGEVARATLTLLGLLIGAYLLWRVQEVLVLLLLAVMLATAIEPLVNRLRRGPFSRGAGVLVVYTAIIVLIGIPTYLVVPALAAQSDTFLNNVPTQLQVLRRYSAAIQPAAARQAIITGLDEFSAAVQSPASPAGEQIVAVSATAAHTVVSFLTIFVLAFYWLVERASIKRVVLRAASARHARNVNTVWLEIEDKLGGWVRGQLLLMLIVGAVAGVFYALIGLPNPLLLAVVSGLFEIVPIVGAILAFAPAALVALAFDPPKALAVVLFALIVQPLQTNVLVPRILRRTVGVSPLTVSLGILAGSALYGLPGAFLAVPVAAAAQVILAHFLRLEDSSQAEEHPVRERHNATGGREAVLPSVRPAKV